jgi:hypothetical protein
MAKALIHVMALDYVLANLISSAKNAVYVSQGTLTFHVVRVSRQTAFSLVLEQGYFLTDHLPYSQQNRHQAMLHLVFIFGGLMYDYPSLVTT